MRIDRLDVENFKGFAKQGLDLHPNFTLLVGDNGSGKTSMLDALAVAAAIWLVEPPDSILTNSGRKILPSEIRLESRLKGDRIQFQEMHPVVVRATGIIDNREVEWSRELIGKRTSNGHAKHAMERIRNVFARDGAGENVLCPVLAYYGAGRAWLPSNQRAPKPKASGVARRWAAFYDCFNERIRFAELQNWFSREAVERGNRGGRWRPGYEVVKRAILCCIPGADEAWFDTDRNQIVLSINKIPQPFDNLSAGYRMMLAVVADLAIKSVTQNAFLLPPDELGPEDEQIPRVLKQTPGIVLIDELDVHLHPSWQRRVTADLKRTFPGIQFVCTSHSPQVMGELKRDEVRVLDGDMVTKPRRSYGLDSSRILTEEMGASERNESVAKNLKELFQLIDKEDFSGARDRLSAVEEELGPDDPEITRARALMSFLESKV